MAAALPYSRTLSKQLLARSTRSFTRPVTTNSLLRVSCNCTANKCQQAFRNDFLNLAAIFKQARSYATTTTKATRKPRARPGRPAAKRRTTTKKPAKKKAGRKPKKKTVKKAAPRVKKPLSKTAQNTKDRAARVNLRTAALLDRPKQLPSTAFQLLLIDETKKGHGDVRASSTSASSIYKNLSSEDRERLNHEANTNKEKNELAYKRWVQSHSPLDIKKANNARKQLTALAKAAGRKTHYQAIHDDRLVKRPRNPYSYFFGDRHASGDLKGLTVGESGKLIGREWRELSASGKKPYADRAAADKTRYLEEHKSVYGEDSPSLKKKKA